MDVDVKFGDSGSNHSRYIRAAHFVMDDDVTTADAGHDIGAKAKKAIRRFGSKERSRFDSALDPSHESRTRL